MSIKDLVRPWLDRWDIENTDALTDWLGSMRLLTVPQHQVVVRAGERSELIYLVQSGLVRLYYTTEDGKERNKAFYGAGDVTGPVSAIMTGHAASFSIQALEPCELIQADLQLLLHIAPNHSDISRLMIKLLADAFMRNEQREALLLTCNAEQRYNWLLDNQAGLVERIPQYHIASYLGVEAVSLSRLKRKQG